jgi:CRP-like cAMP-binding protein
MNDSPPEKVKAKHLDRGLVKFPPNIQAIYVEQEETGLTRLIVRQNELRLSFVLDADDCAHLARLLRGASGDS